MPAPRRSRVGGSVPWATRRVPLVATIPTWMEGARCTETDPEIFFPLKGESAKPAKKICLSCEQRVVCLEWAVATDQDEFGVLGGKTAQQRRKDKRDALKAADATPLEVAV